jgi:hypothetical protein
MRSIVIIVPVLLLSGISPGCFARAQSAHTAAIGSEASFPMPYAPVEARRQLMARLANLVDPALRRRYRLMIEFGAPLFPPDEQIEVDAVRRGGLGADLHRWLHLSPELRRFDLLVLPDVDYFWPAGIQPRGHHPPYSAAFILHMEPTAEGKTAVHVLQINSMARFGKKFDLLGRTGPKFYWDDRPVPPSPQAARDLIGHLAGAAR